jgi:hypothetical protein
MKMPRRIALSPCDYLVFNHHCFMRHKAQGDYGCFMVLELDGHVDPDRVRQAMAGALLAHPVMAASLRVSVLYGRPYWTVPRLTEADARLAAGIAHRAVDLRNGEDSEGRLHAWMSDSLSAKWSHSYGPLLRLDQYTLPTGRTRFILRWPHFLTDAEGAQRFLAEVERLDRKGSSPGTDAEGPAPAAAIGVRTVDPLRGYSWLARWWLAGRCFRQLRQPLGAEVKPLRTEIFPPVSDHRCLHRHWDSGRFRTIREKAKAATPPGPGLYARHLVAAAIRALDRVYAGEGVTTGAYVLAMPFRMPLGPEAGTGARSRPIHGNYLVPMSICGRRDLVADRAAMGEDILRQYTRFTEDHRDVTWCAMMWALGRLRLSMYQTLLRLQLGFVPLASGFSYYGETDPPLRRFLGARVLNLYGGGVVASPPGWNLVFSRFDEGLNLSVTYPRPAVSDALTERYIRWIEEEMFAG